MMVWGKVRMRASSPGVTFPWCQGREHLSFSSAVQTCPLGKEGGQGLKVVNSHTSKWDQTLLWWFFILSVERGTLKYQSAIVDLSISHCSCVFLVYFETLVMSINILNFMFS